MKLRNSTDGKSLFWRLNGEMLKVEAWGADGARVRATNLRDFPTIPGALEDAFPAPGASASTAPAAELRYCPRRKVVLTNGKLRAELWADGTLHFFNALSGAAAARRAGADLQQAARALVPPAGQRPFHVGGCTSAPSRGERIFGLGQHQHGLLDNKGA